MRDNSTCDSCVRIYLAVRFHGRWPVPTVPPSLATQLTKRGQALTTATTGEARVEIDAAPLTVYQLISDITRMGDWSPECYRCEWLNGATTAAIGARFRGHNRLGKVRWHTDAIVTVADPGWEFAFTTLHKEGREETLWRYELRQVGAGTEVIESYRFLWCPVANRIAEIPVPRDKQLRSGIQETLKRIKTAAEQGL
jgi:hypothetical protein